MPRCLVLDWDQDRCHILLGDLTRSGIKIESAVAWDQGEILNAAQGEEAGKKLKDFLKSAHLAAAPLLVCLPKQRVLVKEVRCPSVAADDEPALVRFQAAKELLENPDDLVLDYAPLSRSSTESLLLLAAARKELLAGYNALAKAAGLKLLAVTPRPFVLADLLARCRKIDPVPSAAPMEWSGVLLLGGGWAELAILHGQTVCFSRSMASDDGLEAEVRRSLAMFAAQPQGRRPQILYLFGPGATAPLQERLARALNMPVTRPNLFTSDDDRSVDAPAAVGLLASWGAEKVPVNFAKPKEPKPPAQGNQRLWLLAAGGAVVVLAFFMLLSQQMLANTRNLIAEAKEDKEKIEKMLKGFEQERLDLEAMQEWEQGSIPWIDELYDMAARFPFDSPGFHLTKLEGNVNPRRSGKDKYQARVVLNGVHPPGQRERFQDRLPDDHIQLLPVKSDGNKFTVTVDLARQPASRYVAQLEGPSNVKQK